MEERAVLPLGVIRDGRIVHANARLAAYLGYTIEEIVGTSFVSHVAERDRVRVFERHERRVRGESVPDAYELELVRKDGSSRQAEVYVAVEASGDVLFELADRTHLSRRRANLRELAGLGAAVQSKHDEANIFATLADGLVALGVAWGRVEPDGDELVVIDAGAADFSMQRLEQEAHIVVRGSRAPWAAAARRAWAEGSEFLDDLPLSAAQFFGAHGTEAGEIARGVARASGLGRAIALRIDVNHEPRQLLFVMADWLLEEDLASFGLLRIQVSAALDAARVIADLSERNDELAALNQISAVAGTGDLDALFDVTARTIEHLLAPLWLSIYLFDEQTGDANLAYQSGIPTDAVPTLAHIAGPGTMFQRIQTTGKPMIWRWEDLPLIGQLRLDRIRFATAASVPLIAGARIIGTMTLAQPAGVEVLPSHSELLQAIGAHFAAAVQARRLLDDLRRSYADLARTQEQLVQRERLAALGELAAIVAHEIRNPLGAVFNAIGAIRRQAQNQSDTHLTTLIAILDEEARRMNEIVGDLLDFARPVSAALRPERIESIVTEALDAATHDATGPVTVERDVATDLPAVPIDSRLLRQAILNVALNAVQALGGRGGVIKLRINQDNGSLRIEIADNGPGIESEHQGRVFEPFFTTRPSGTGLGLTVVKRIVDVHHGETSLRTESGKGTTFVIRLPVVS